MSRSNSATAGRSVSVPRRPSLVTAVAPEPSVWRTLRWLVPLVLLPRAVLFFLNESYFGDAVVRSELAERWAESPRVYTAFGTGAFQFGPLHLYLLGLATRLWHSREHVGRLVSLLLGVATVFPLHALTSRLFGRRAALVACLCFSVWGLHLQLSTTAASEALGLFLWMVLVALLAKARAEGTLGPLLAGAAVLNLLCATRYDAWMLIPLICLLLWRSGGDRVAATTRAIAFGLASLPFPLAWMHGNELFHGDPFFPVRYIDRFHREWFAAGVAVWGEPLYRLQNLVFWPGVAFVTLTPLVAFFGIVGLVRAFRRRPETRWLVWLALVPTLYFTVRSAAFGTFVPLARFAVNQVALLLPFVLPGFEELAGEARPVVRRTLAGLTVATAVAIPLWLGVFTFRTQGKWENSLRPVSPTSTQPEGVRRVAAFLKSEVNARGEAVILDQGPEYVDLSVAFFSGLPESRLARHRWEIFPERLATSDPRFLVLIDGGTLERSPTFAREGAKVRLGPALFEELPPAIKPFHLYRRVAGSFAPRAP